MSAARCAKCQGLLPAWLTAAGGATSAKCPNCSHVNDLAAMRTPAPQSVTRTNGPSAPLGSQGVNKSASLNKTMFMASGNATAPQVGGQKAAGLAKTMMMARPAAPARAPAPAPATPPAEPKAHKRVPTLPSVGATGQLPVPEFPPTAPLPVPAPLPVIEPAPAVAAAPVVPAAPLAAASPVDSGESEAYIDVELDTPPPAPPSKTSLPSWVVSEPLGDEQPEDMLLHDRMAFLRSRPVRLGAGAAGVVGLALAVVMLTRGHNPKGPISVEVKRPVHEKLTPPPTPEPVAEPARPAPRPAPEPARAAVARKVPERKAPEPKPAEPRMAEPARPRPVATATPPAPVPPPAEHKPVVASARHVAAASPPEHARRGGVPSEDDQRLARDAYARGNTQLYQGHADEAISAFKDSLRLDSRNPAVMRGMGLAYGQAGNAGQAVQYLKRYLKASPAASDRALIEKRIEQLSAH